MKRILLSIVFLASLTLTACAHYGYGGHGGRGHSCQHDSKHNCADCEKKSCSSCKEKNDSCELEKDSKTKKEEKK